MTTNASDRQAWQIWADTTKEVMDKAKRIADERRMTFRGWVGLAIEKAIDEEVDAND